MNKIYRYTVPVDDQWHEIYLTSDPLHVSSRVSGELEFWAWRNPGAPTDPRNFMVIGTGHEVPNSCKYWGTAQDAATSSLIWHLVEAQ